MAISKFIIPAGGLVVTGSTILSGTVVVTDNVSVTQLTASGHVSASNGYFANLDVNQLTAPSLNLAGDLIVSGNTTLGYPDGADIVAIKAQLTASSGVEVSGGDLKVLAGALSASSTLQAGGQATLAGGLVVSGAPLNALTVAVSASNLSASGDSWVGGDLTVGTDLIVAGDLTVNGALTYINTQDLQVSDSKVVVAYGSLDGADAGIYVSSQTSPFAKFYFNGTDAWLSDKSVKVTGDLSASVKVTAPNAEFNTISGSASGSQAQFGQITGSTISASTSVVAPGVGALAFGTARAVVPLTDNNPTGVDTYNPATLYSTVKYVISAKDATTGDVHAMEAMVTSDGTLAGTVLVPYASLYSNVALFSLAATYSGGNVIVTATRSVANTVNLKVLALTA